MSHARRGQERVARTRSCVALSDHSENGYPAANRLYTTPRPSLRIYACEEIAYRFDHMRVNIHLQNRHPGDRSRFAAVSRSLGQGKDTAGDLGRQ